MPHFRADLYADINRLLDLAERALRPVDRLDYAIRRYLIPVPFKEAPSIQPLEVPVEVQGTIQEAIGQHLRAQPLPPRLAHLLREFEQRSKNADAFAKSGYASTA
jgi:hypothetical protein